MDWARDFASNFVLKIEGILDVFQDFYKPKNHPRHKKSSKRCPYIGANTAIPSMITSPTNETAEKIVTTEISKNSTFLMLRIAARLCRCFSSCTQIKRFTGLGIRETRKSKIQSIITLPQSRPSCRPCEGSSQQRSLPSRHRHGRQIPDKPYPSSAWHSPHGWDGASPQQPRQRRA